MIPSNSYVVIVNDRIHNYYNCVVQAIVAASKLANNGASVVVENLEGDTVKLYHPHKGPTCKQPFSSS